VGLKTQNYDKGMDRFARKFDPGVEMCATVAVYSGRYEGHGWEVYCTQESRRCFLLDSTYGLSDKEAFWTAFSAWGTFQPIAAKPRQGPGKIFSHMMEKYWE
jgi:hypothetical protein